MSTHETTIRVNFGRPMPIFPLGKTLLMPHGVIPLHIFEERYRQMISDALDGAGQIAMAVFAGDRWKTEYQGRPPVRPAVCIGHVVQHVRLPDGGYNVILQGICRAKISQEVPAVEGRLYREAVLEPIGLEYADEAVLEPYRRQLSEELESKPLSDLRGAAKFAEHLSTKEIPASAIMELLALSFLDDPELRYKLLSTGDIEHRAQLVTKGMEHLKTLLKRAAWQRRPAEGNEGSAAAPKGCSWN